MSDVHGPDFSDRRDPHRFRRADDYPLATFLACDCPGCERRRRARDLEDALAATIKGWDRRQVPPRRRLAHG